MESRRVRAHPRDVLYNLRAVSYPASRQDLIAAAETDGANEQVLETLQVLEPERFADRAAVEQALDSGLWR
jgi:Protein of unknown function (DUF2795)